LGDTILLHKELLHEGSPRTAISPVALLYAALGLTCLVLVFSGFLISHFSGYDGKIGFIVGIVGIVGTAFLFIVLTWVFSIQYVRKYIDECTIGKKLVEEKTESHRKHVNRIISQQVKPMAIKINEMKLEIEQRKNKERALEKSEEIYRGLWESSPIPILVHSDGQVVFINTQAMKTLGGVDKKSFTGRPLQDFIHPEFRKIARKRAMRVYARQGSAEMMEMRMIRIDKEPIYVEVVGNMLDYAGKPSSQMVFRDITFRKLAEEKEKKYEAQLLLATSVFQNTMEGIAISDPDGYIQKVNPAFTQITGYTEKEARGKDLWELKSDRDDMDLCRKMWKTLEETGNWSGEIWNRRKNGEAYPEWLSVSEIRGKENDILNFIAVFHDVADARRSEEQLEYQANHDALTGLPNRQLFNDRLGRAIAYAHRSRRLLAVLVIDLDDFKHINDSLGHASGDLFLQEIAIRLQNMCSPEDTVSRFGGDEFAFLLPHIESSQDAAEAAERIIESFSHPILLRGYELFGSVSVGISIYPTDGEDQHAIVKNAELALHQARKMMFQDPNMKRGVEPMGLMIEEFKIKNRLSKEAKWFIFGK